MDYGTLTDEQLVVKLKAREGRAAVELARRYGGHAGVFIWRMNSASLSKTMAQDAVVKALEIVRNTVEDTADSELGVIVLKDLVSKTADMVGVLLWRRLNEGEEGDDASTG